jgi:hypothetical protein
MDRMATCPRCGNPVRLTKDELIQKRGTCLICDETFDVTLSDLREGDAPYRAPPAAIVARRSAIVLPGVREDVDRRRIELKSQRTNSVIAVSFLSWVPLLIIVVIAASRGHFNVAMLLPFIIALGFLGRTRLLGGRDTLQVADGQLSVTRRFFKWGRTRSFPLAHVRDVYVAERTRASWRDRDDRHLNIAMADGTIVKVGDHLGLDEHTLARVKEWLQDRIKEPQRQLEPGSASTADEQP